MFGKSIAINKTDLLQLDIVLPLIAFLIPFFISNPQILTGSIVNCFLYIFATKLPLNKAAPIVILPSIGALLNGLLFGGFTPYVLFFLPFIWIGNYVLVYSFGLISDKKYHGSVALIGSAFLKTAVIFIPALFFVNFHIVPSIFLQAMGIFQLVTAMLGGITAFGMITIDKKYGRS